MLRSPERTCFAYIAKNTLFAVDLRLLYSALAISYIAFTAAASLICTPASTNALMSGFGNILENVCADRFILSAYFLIMSFLAPPIFSPVSSILSFGEVLSCSTLLSVSPDSFVCSSEVFCDSTFSSCFVLVLFCISLSLFSSLSSSNAFLSSFPSFPFSFVPFNLLSVEAILLSMSAIVYTPLSAYFLESLSRLIKSSLFSTSIVPAPANFAKSNSVLLILYPLPSFTKRYLIFVPSRYSSAAYPSAITRWIKSALDIVSPLKETLSERMPSALPA